MHPFEGLAEVEASLSRLAAGAEPLVAELPREPGQKERRWAHLAAGRPPERVSGIGGSCSGWAWFPRVPVNATWAPLGGFLGGKGGVSRVASPAPTIVSSAPC
jgi:hypothetical protein